jgi:hypothetical protein
MCYGLIFGLEIGPSHRKLIFKLLVGGSKMFENISSTVLNHRGRGGQGEGGQG